MSSKDEKNLTQVTDRIVAMDEPARSTIQRVHEIIMTTAPTLEPRRGEDGTLMPAASCYPETVGAVTERRIAETVRSVVG